MKKLLLACAVSCSIAMTSCSSEPEATMVEKNFEFITSQLPVALAATDSVRADLIASGELKKGLSEQVIMRSINADGTLHVVGTKDWTCGFFPGLLWYAYEYTGDQKWAVEADKYSMKIEEAKTITNTHDTGFMIYCSFGNGYRLTGNEAYKDIIVEASNSLISRFNPTIGCLRSWDHHVEKWNFPVIIDNMMNLEMLCEATKMTGDSTYYNIAVSHADVTMANHFRDDYSTFHVVDYDNNGVAVHHHTHQGYAHESSWARGQAWGIYGYTMMFRETGDQKYLDQANNIANFILTNPTLPEDKVPFWDFDAPEIPNEPRDVSAAGIIASALYELSTYTPEKAAEYKAVADLMLETISEKFLAEAGGDYGFITTESTGSRPLKSEIAVPINYADYYFAEALIRKDRLEKTGSVFAL